MVSEVNEGDKSAWNLSQDLILQIGSLIGRVSNRWDRGDVMGSFYSVQEIKVLIWTDLSKEERIELKKIEADVHLSKREFLSAIKRREENALSRRIPLQIRDKTPTLVMRYRLRIMELLDKYGYLISRKQDSKRIR